MNIVGALCFGVVIGYITYRTLVRTVDKTAISDLAAVIAALGGAAVTKIFDPTSALFSWYAVGLLLGMAVFFGLYLRLNGKEATGTVMGAPDRSLSHGTPADVPGEVATDGTRLGGPRA